MQFYWLTYSITILLLPTAFVIVHARLFKGGNLYTNGGKQPSAPGPSSPSQCRTTETNQIITTTKCHKRKQYLSKQKTHILEQSLSCEHACTCPSVYTNSAKSERSERSVCEVRATPQWKMHDTSATQHTHQLHAGKPHTWASHLKLGFLQHSTMGSSPDCYSQALSISQPLFWQGMCWPFFYPYHRQTSSPRPGHTPSSPIKQSHSRGQSRVCFPSGDPITFRSKLMIFPSELHGYVTAFPSFASFSYSLTDIHNILSAT